MTLPTRTRTTARTFSPAHLRWLRHALCESTREFAARWNVSARTVESWEQGHRHPNKYLVPRILKMYREQVAACTTVGESTTG